MDDHRELTAAYALDALDPRERERYEGHLATCEECREELASFWAVSGALAHAAGGPPPPPALRKRILEQARAERPNVVPFRRRSVFSPGFAAAAAAAVLALGLGLWGSSLARELDDVRSARDSDRQAIEIISDSRARKVPFAGAEGHLILASTGRAAVVLSGLAPAPQGKTYELWVVEDGISHRAGLFEGGNKMVLALQRTVPKRSKVAVTLEVEGGVDAPTGPPLFQTITV